MAAAALAGITPHARFGPRQRRFEIEHRLQHGRIGEDLATVASVAARLSIKSREHASILHVEEDRLAVALQPDLEAPSVGLPCHALRQQRGAPLLGHQCQHRVVALAGSPAK